MAPIQTKFSFRYGSHLPVVLQALLKTRGPVLELGAGLFSTPLLNAFALAQDRRVVTCENARRWFRWFSIYTGPQHSVRFVDNWDDLDVGDMWDVALVDHSPDDRRCIEIRRLAHKARYIICHDANEKYWQQYGYAAAFAEFKYNYLYKRSDPYTMILSNFVDLSDFWEKP
jgi:hypothetical protein